MYMSEEEMVMKWAIGVINEAKNKLNLEQLNSLWYEARKVTADGGLKGDVSERWVAMGYREELRDLYL